MTETRAPKKSETLEIRIPYPTKTAFMEKARLEGRAASEIVREQIDAYLNEEPEPQTLKDKVVVQIRRNLRGAGLLLAGAGSALAISLAASPASALPGRGATLDAPSGVTTDAGDPLMIVVDLPAGGLTATQLGELVGKAFARLDKDSNGLILPGE
jgi:predicted DNA-binding protein